MAAVLIASLEFPVKVFIFNMFYNHVAPSIALLYSLCRAGGVERRRREPSEINAQRGERHVSAISGSMASARSRPTERPVRHSRNERY